MAEKLRVHQLADDLGVTSKVILAKCRAEEVEGMKNHMSTLSAGLAETVREWFSDGQHATTIETSQRVDLEKARATRKRTRRKKATAKAAAAPADTSAGETATAVAEAPATAVAEAPAPVAPPAPEDVAPAVVVELPAPLEAAPVLPPTPVVTDAPTTAEPAAPPAAAESPVEPVPLQPAASAEPSVAAEAPPTEAPAPAPALEPPAEPIAPVGPQNVPAPPTLQGPRVIRVEAPEPVYRPPPRPGPRDPARPSGPGPGPTESPMGPGATGRKGKGRTAGAGGDSAARRGRSRVHPRRSMRSADAGERMREWGERDLVERQERLQQAKERGLHGRRATEAGGGQRAELARPSKATVSEPIILHEFCSATSLSMRQIVPRLMKGHGVFATRNTALEPSLAEVVALEFGVELEIVKARTGLEVLAEEYAARERKNLETRGPVVTFLGHVDHGKTSLLDAIRQTQVASGEAGGITQHIGAYRLDREAGAVTFLDTPGHEAFTAMRARGAQMTDVVVLVVAADDGVMPQTIEAINHARAANVAMVVAMNKIDVPNADLNRAYGQLAEHQLVPVEWGGETDVIKTSAITGEGVDTLVDHLATLAELLELEADPSLPARGTVIESEMREGVGVVVRILIQDGTLKRGDFIVCGPASGRVRSIKDHTGKVLQQAGPATPVEVTGLDAVPDAADSLFALDSLQRAKAIAEEIQQHRREASLTRRRKPKTLEELLSQRDVDQVPELNVIVKADVQGSVDVLTKTLSGLPTDEVRLRILHAGVGGVTESDVLLAEASEAVIVGFHVVADSAAQRLADHKGVSVRLYRVIYELTDDIRGALEGLLTPETRVEVRGKAEVREVFRITRVGVVAGCRVTEGVISRHHRVRLIRDLKLERDESELASLRRFKDDVREVRAGMECGIRIAGFDDVHPGDVIESVETIEIKRTL